MLLPKILLNEQQASETVGLAVKTLRKRRWQGAPPRYMKVGSKVFYDQNDIQNYLESCIRESTSQR